MAGHTPRQGPPIKGAPAGRSSSQPPQKRQPSGKKSQAPGKKPAPKKPNFAARRLLALLLIVGLAAAIVWGSIAGYGLVRERFEANAEPKEVVEPTDAPFTGQPTGCEADVTAWTFAVNAGKAGQKVPFSVTITNNGEIPCLVDAGAASLVFNVSSGDDEIWSNAHCSSDNLMLLLGSGDSTERWVTWGGNRSVAGCTAVDAEVEPGTYKVMTTYKGRELPEGSLVFTLY